MRPQAAGGNANHDPSSPSHPPPNSRAQAPQVPAIHALGVALCATHWLHVHCRSACPLRRSPGNLGRTKSKRVTHHRRLGNGGNHNVAVGGVLAGAEGVLQEDEGEEGI